MSETENTPPVETTKADVIAQIGKTLTERRKARSLTLERVHQNIKIRVPYLQAMENGNWEELPGEVFLRGFIRRYAIYLGLDADKLMAPYMEKMNQPVKKSAELAPMFKKVDPIKMGWIWIAAAALVGIGIFKMIRVRPASTMKSAASTAYSPSVAASTATARATERGAEKAKHELDVYSPYPLWIRVQSDDRGFEGFIPEGATWSWKGEGRFVVRLGHTKQVAMFFDGAPVTIEDNQKKIDLPPLVSQ